MSGDSERDSPAENGDSKNESDQEKQNNGPATVGFWDHRLKATRNEAFLKWTVTTGLLMAFIIACLSIYWGVFSRVENNLSSLVVYVVDFDGQTEPYNTSDLQPIVGPQIVQLAQQMVASSTPNLGYTPLQPSQFDYDPLQVRKAVYDWDAWAAIIVNPNATALLYSAVQNGNSSYDPMGACQLVYLQARDQTNWESFLFPHISQFLTQATSMVGETWARQIMQQATSNQTLLENMAQAPSALSPAIGFSMFNLRPFYPYVSIPAVSIGLIYLIIISFFSFSFYLPIHFKYLKPEGHPPLKFWQLVLWRWCATISAYFMLSLAYSFISMAFQMNFYGGVPNTGDPTQVTPTVDGYKNPAAWGHGTFPVYWMLNFFGMIALGLACENVAMIVGQPWTGLWLIFWVITNVSTAFYDIGIEPGFYHFGYAWPLHYVVEGSRQILFDLHSRLGIDFGVLIAWGAVNSILFPFACYFMRWKSKHHVHEHTHTHTTTTSSAHDRLLGSDHRASMAMSDTGSSFAQWAALYHHHHDATGPAVLPDDDAAADVLGIGIGTTAAAAAVASPTSGGSSGGGGSPTKAAGVQHQQQLHGVEGPRIGKPAAAARRRSRASRRAPVTLLNTDTANFRAMVQQFTGIPAPPAGAFGVGAGGAPLINFAADYAFPPSSAVMSFDHHQQQLHRSQHAAPPLQEQLRRQQQYTGASSPFGYGNSFLQGGGGGGDIFASHGGGFAASAEDRMLLQSIQAAQMPPMSAANTSTNGFFA